MNILVLSTWYPFPPDNGSKVRAYQLIRALLQDHSVTLVAFSPPCSTDTSYARDHEMAGLKIHAVPADPFHYVNLPTPVKHLSPVPLAFWISQPMAQTVERVYRSAEWDAVVAIQAPAARYGTQLPDVPRMLDVDTALSYQLLERHRRSLGSLARVRTWISWRKAQKYERHLFRKFGACTVVSAAEIDHLQAMVAGSSCRVSVSPNGVDCARNYPGLAEPVPGRLVYNGALTYSANYSAMQYYLEEIHPVLRFQEPNATLTITGSTDGVSLSGLRLDESVFLSGYVRDVRTLIASAEVCVVPILHGGGTRLKILEAMALGTPVVSTSKGAEGLEVIPEQDIFIADAPEQFAAQVLRLLRDPDLRRRLSKHARSLVEQRYDWQKIGQRFVELVENTANKQGKE